MVSKTFSFRRTLQRDFELLAIEKSCGVEGAPLFDLIVPAFAEMVKRWEAAYNPAATLLLNYGPNRGSWGDAAALSEIALVAEMKAGDDNSAKLTALEYVHRNGFTVPGKLGIKYRDVFSDLQETILGILLDLIGPAPSGDVAALSGDTTTAPALVPAPAPILDPGAAPAPAPAGDPR